MTGTVKWFNDSQEFGFITPDDGGEDLYVQFSANSMPDYRTLTVGQRVSFDVVNGYKGKEAVNVQVI